MGGEPVAVSRDCTSTVGKVFFGLFDLNCANPSGVVTGNSYAEVPTLWALVFNHGFRVGFPAFGALPLVLLVFTHLG